MPTVTGTPTSSSTNPRAFTLPPLTFSVPIADDDWAAIQLAVFTEKSISVQYDAGPPLHVTKVSKP